MYNDEQKHITQRLVEFRSRTVQKFADGEWTTLSADLSTSAQFNAWADKNDMNPVSNSTITINEHKDKATDGAILLTTTYALSVAVMPRADHLRASVEALTMALRAAGLALQATSGRLDVAQDQDVVPVQTRSFDVVKSGWPAEVPPAPAILGENQ